MSDISSSEDLIDVRDIIARVEELEKEALSESDFEFLSRGGPYDEGNKDGVYLSELTCVEWDLLASADSSVKFEVEELRVLKGFLEELAGNGGDEQWRGDWYPVTLIRSTYFTDYTKEFAEDIGAINRDAQWPLQHIDWEAASDELKTDYGQIEYDGVTFYYR